MYRGQLPQVDPVNLDDIHVPLRALRT
jgi:hypothetical protein